MAKIWQGISNKEIEKFTVGEDYLLDQKLVKYDCIASIAHSKMLAKAGILNLDEQKNLDKELKSIIGLSAKGKFEINLEDEDCHTAIENYLTKKLGDLGKKIHTARSRNDQVKVALALYSKDELNEIKSLVLNLIKSLKKLDLNIEMPGYTHYQKAMPSSFSLWSKGYIVALEDDFKLLEGAYSIIDQNPLGSAAGYGVPLKIDKELTTKELGFKKVQETAYVQISRGKFEAVILSALSQVMITLNKISSDLILFNMNDLGFVTLPDEFTTGSSIMPQKKNPDVLELVRAKYSIVLGYEFSVKNLVSNLISGYHRDFQLTKEPLMKGIDITKDCLGIMALVIGKLKINKENCKKAMTKELYATEKVYSLVKKGKSFREAYKEVKKGLL
ncbi:MAG: argininosuccinate lyase [Nanoarchaeota archaeon]|nr:argininosuccinate lyase [Nanoarchaeota archaeon]